MTELEKELKRIAFNNKYIHASKANVLSHGWHWKHPKEFRSAQAMEPSQHVTEEQFSK